MKSVSYVASSGQFVLVNLFSALALAFRYSTPRFGCNSPIGPWMYAIGLTYA